MDLGRGVSLRKALVGLWIVGAAAALATPVGAQSQEQPQAQPQTSVDAFMTEIGDSMRAIHTRANGDAAQVVAGCRDFLGRVLNLETMARAVTEAAWERMSVAQREAYQAAFADRLASECARALADYKGEAITLAGVRATPDTTVTVDRVAKAADMAGHAAKAGQVAVPGDRADHGAESGNFSARKKCASFAWKKWTWWTTSAPTSCRSLFRSAARFCRGV